MNKKLMHSIRSANIKVSYEQLGGFKTDPQPTQTIESGLYVSMFVVNCED